MNYFYFFFYFFSVMLIFGFAIHLFAAAIIANLEDESVDLFPSEHFATAQRKPVIRSPKHAVKTRSLRYDRTSTV